MRKSLTGILTVLMALVLCIGCMFVFAACGGEEDDGGQYAVTITGDNVNNGAVSLKPGDTLALTAKVTDNGRVDSSLTVEWSTSDGAVATVSSGTVTAVSAGTADITATYKSASAKVSVTVSATEEFTYKGQTGGGDDEYMGDPLDVYWLDASVQCPDNYSKIVGMTLTVYIDSLDYYGGGKDTQEFECGMILATKGAHSPEEYVFTYDNGQYPEYSLSTKDIVAFGFGDSSFLVSLAFSNGKASNSQAKAGDTLTLTYSTGGDKALFSADDSVMTLVSFLGKYTYKSVEWELGNPTDVEEEWDTVATKEWTDVDTVEPGASYTNNGQNYVDITIPDTGKSSYPVILWIHGGGFITGDKANVALATTKEWLLAQGYAFVSANYTLTTSDGTEDGDAYGAAGMPQMIKDIKLAIRFIRANASTYSLDTSFIAAMGESAGAGLALLCATTNSGSYAREAFGDTYYEDKTMGWSSYSSDIDAAISYCGTTVFTDQSSSGSDDFSLNMSAYIGYEDYAKCFDESGSLASDMQATVSVDGESMTKWDALCMLWSPADIIDSSCCPLYLTYSESDTTVPISQYNYLESMVELYNVTSKSLIYEENKGIGHVDRSGFDQYSAFVSLTNWLDEIRAV